MYVVGSREGNTEKIVLSVLTHRIKSGINATASKFGADSALNAAAASRDASF